MYNEPLCKKCLHPENLHTLILAQLADDTQLKRCAVGICSCIISTGQKVKKQKAVEA